MQSEGRGVDHAFQIDVVGEVRWLQELSVVVEGLLQVAGATGDAGIGEYVVDAAMLLFSYPIIRCVQEWVVVIVSPTADVSA